MPLTPEQHRERERARPYYHYGCADPHCGHDTVPTAFEATPYDKCPVCGGPWVLNPPKRIVKPKATPARADLERTSRRR